MALDIADILRRQLTYVCNARSAGKAKLSPKAQRCLSSFACRVVSCLGGPLQLFGALADPPQILAQETLHALL